jgi:hypothetical protein
MGRTANKLRHKLLLAFAVPTFVCGACAIPVVAKASQPVDSPFAFATPTVVSTGNVTARIVPVSGVKHDTSGVECNGDICMQIIGSGLHWSDWWMEAGPLVPDECTWGTYWINSKVGKETAYLCNDSDGLAEYEANWYDGGISGNATGCNTAWGIAGKPCAYIHK